MLNQYLSLNVGLKHNYVISCLQVICIVILNPYVNNLFSVDSKSSCSMTEP